MDKDVRIRGILRGYYEEAVKRGFDILAVSAKGSINYCIDIPGSDVDATLVAIPKAKDIVLGNVKISSSINTPDGICNICDVPSYFNKLKKQKIDALEFLATEYILINEEYSSYLTTLIQNLNKISKISPYNAVQGFVGYGNSYYTCIMKVQSKYTNLEEAIQYANKYYINMLRVIDLTQRYIKGLEQYRSLIVPNEHKSLRQMRLESVPTTQLTLDYIKKQAEYAMRSLVYLRGVGSRQFDGQYDEEAANLLDSIKYDIMKHRVSEVFKQS